MSSDQFMVFGNQIKFNNAGTISVQNNHQVGFLERHVYFKLIFQNDMIYTMYLVQISWSLPNYL